MATFSYYTYALTVCLGVRGFVLCLHHNAFVGPLVDSCRHPQALQTYTGALIQIDQTVEPTKVTISGTPHSLSLAVSMVTDIVKGTFKGGHA